MNRFPAISTAVAFVEKNLANGTWQAGDRLPSIRTLADMARVSKVTMAGALRELKGKRLVASLAHRRYFAGSQLPSSAGPRAKSLRMAPWRRLRDVVEKDIIIGAIAPMGQ